MVLRNKLDLLLHDEDDEVEVDDQVDQLTHVRMEILRTVVMIEIVVQIQV